MTDWRLPDWLFLPVYACFQMCWLFSWTAELARPWPCQGWVRARKKFTISLFLVALIYKGFSAFQVKVITHSNANPAPASWNWMICLSSNLQGHYGVSWTLQNYLFPLSATKWNLLRTHLLNLARHDWAITSHLTSSMLSRAHCHDWNVFKWVDSRYTSKGKDSAFFRLTVLILRLSSGHITCYE